MDDHPAKFPPIAIDRARELLKGYKSILDPFAGVGGVHALGDGFFTFGVEIEPEWAEAHPRTWVGDATDLSFIPSGSINGFFCSPCYGNRMADHHNAKDPSKRHTYKHVLGHDLRANNAGAMQWGEEYRALHRLAWKEATRVAARRARFVMVIKNHIRKGVEQRVVEFHIETMVMNGWKVTSKELLRTPGMRHGANYALRCPEYLVVFDR